MKLDTYSNMVSKSKWKPVVKFDKEVGVVLCGDHALLHPLNHPDIRRVSNKTVVSTSSVLKYEENSGRITALETENTIYKEQE